MICTVDTTTTSQDDRITVRLNNRCVEDRSMFRSTLTYGSCSNGQNSPVTTNFSGSGIASFMLNVSNFFGDVCIRAETTYQNQQEPLCTDMKQLKFIFCSVAEIHSVADSSVTLNFSATAILGEVPHGTVATFKVLGCVDILVGTKHSTCHNGKWSDLSFRTSYCK